MSVTDVTSRISEIQSQLALLSPTGASGGAAFASAMQSTLSSSGALDTAGALDPSSLDPSAAGTSAAPTFGARSGDAVVAEARKFLGVPYVWGGTDPKTGLDCSGLVQHVYADLGYDLPRVSGDQARAGRPVASMAQAQPGDILAFGSPVHHVGIYIGDGQMIEAPRPGLDVRVGPVYETPSAIRRVVDDPGSVSLGSTSARVGAATPYAGLFESAGQKYGVSPALLAAVAGQESGYDPGAVSPAGAQGLMQLMPATARGLGVNDSFDPAQAVDGAAKMLRGLIDRFGGTPLALAAYNAGPGAVLRYGGIPPYAETQSYVRSVLARMES
ncbi:MAG: transglycosylase SLT domain-containing protein [Nocardioides sp.]